jgi:hypothetical protein
LAPACRGIELPLVGCCGDTQMFNVFSQTGLPGFRVRPQDDVPGFDIDENGLPRRDRTWSDGTPPGSATPQGVTPVN